MASKRPLLKLYLFMRAKEMLGSEKAIIGAIGIILLGVIAAILIG
ncbi:MAG: hypothetical protein PVI97_20340 [Candidatus Thiodiazotropha sp.]|jgi:hypothetical protein